MTKTGNTEIEKGTEMAQRTEPFLNVRGCDQEHENIPRFSLCYLCAPLILCVSAFTAQAQTLYKCVNPGGKTTYQQEPCYDGKQSTVRPPDARAAKTVEEQKAAADKSAKEVESQLDQVGSLIADISLCQSEVPGFDEKHSVAFQEWKRRNGAAVDKFSGDAAAQSKAVARREAEKARLGGNKAGLAARCEQVAAALGAPAAAAKK